MANVIVVILIIAAVGLAVRFIVKAKKKGQYCIGCPDSGACAGGCTLKSKN